MPISTGRRPGRNDRLTGFAAVLAPLLAGVAPAGWPQPAANETVGHQTVGRHGEAPEPPPGADATVPVGSIAGTVVSDGGTFEITLGTSPDPVRLNEYFELIVSIRATADAADDDSFWAGVEATMPAHRHGMNTTPIRTDLGGGRFSFSGMLLHMAGHWAIELEIAQGRVRERVVVPVALIAGEPLAFSAAERALLLTLSPLPPATLDPTNSVDGQPAAVELGRTLFFDTRLSGNGQISCASCHEPGRDWSDGRPLAAGAGQGRRNTPSLWNVGDHRWFFWDGRADSLWSQALKPIEDAAEMNGSRLAVVDLLLQDPNLREKYVDIFGPLPDAVAAAAPLAAAGGPLALDAAQQLEWWSLDSAARDAVNRIFSNTGKALAAFVATLRSPPAPFDEFVAALRRGDPRSVAISPEAQHGLKIFIGRGNCILCHSGPSFTNKEFHDIRVPVREDMTRPDLGRFEGIDGLLDDEFIAAGPYSDAPESERALQLAFVATQEGVIGHFRTPGLRNVARTAPYMHQGQIATLREVVRHYSTLDNAAPPMDPAHVEFLVERPLALTADEIEAVVAFLESLTSAG